MFEWTVADGPSVDPDHREPSGRRGAGARPRRTYTYKTIGDLRILADVYRKPDDIIRPAILYIHGGALIMGNRSWLNPVQAQKYLDAGYTIISIDYRLAPQAKLNQIIEDLRRRLSMGAHRRSNAVSD